MSSAVANPSLTELATAGAHFGHRRSITDPRAKQSVFMIKDNLSLIDLEKTQQQIAKARQVLAEAKRDGKKILLVGTKRSTRSVVTELAATLNLPVIDERWFGGFLTNFVVFSAQIKRWQKEQSHPVKTIGKKLQKKERMNRFLTGVKDLDTLPDIIVLASASEETTAVKEANRMGIQVIGIADTDVNPDSITFPIVANDDAPKAVRLILETIFAGEAPTKTTAKNIVEEVAETAPKKKKSSAKTKEVKPKAEKKVAPAKIKTEAKPVKKAAAKTATNKKATK